MSGRARRVDFGAFTFDVKYLRGLRNPSGSIILDWTDELDRRHSVPDPRVLVRETRGSRIARVFTRGAAPTKDDHAAAVRTHLGNGWLLVLATETTYIPIIRWISHCVVHFRVRGEE